TRAAAGALPLAGAERLCRVSAHPPSLDPGARLRRFPRRAPGRRAALGPRHAKRRPHGRRQAAASIAMKPRSCAIVNAALDLTKEIAMNALHRIERFLDERMIPFDVV